MTTRYHVLGLILTATLALAAFLQPGPKRAVSSVDHEAKHIESLIEYAEQGHPEAQFQLGAAYEEAMGVERNDRLAFKWYMEAAQQGHPEAQVEVASRYLMGLDGVIVEEAFIEAARWFEMAANQGNVRAQLELGHMLADGLGVEKDLAAAYKWFALAAASGDELAAEQLVLVGTHLSIEERATADELINAQAGTYAANTRN